MMRVPTEYSRFWAAFSLLVASYPLQPDLIITKPPLNLDTISSKCVSSSCWIGVAHGSILFLDSPLIVPHDAQVRLTPWPLLGRAALVAINGSQLGVIEGALSLEALDLYGNVLRTDRLRNGGCIAAGHGAKLNVTNSSFNYCTTFGSGGALSVGENARAHLHHFHAVDGVALEEGGLIYAAHNASVIIDGNSILSLATATSGGLISIGPFATLDIGGNTVLSNGTAEHTGGIIKADLGAHVIVRHAARLEYGTAHEDGGCVCARRQPGGLLRTFHTQLQVYADSDGIIQVQDNTMLRFCSANSTGGGISSWSNVSLSGNAVVFACTAQIGGGMLVFGATAVVELREAAEIIRCAAIAGGMCHLYQPADSSHLGGVANLLDARIVLRDYARIIACTATQVGGGVYGEGRITLADDAIISRCSALVPNAGQGGGIHGVDRALVELRDRAQVVECQVQGFGGCISAVDILIGNNAHVGNCIALKSVGYGIGGCLFATSSIVLRDFATLTHCYADVSGAFHVYNLLQMGTILLSDKVVVSDCTAMSIGAVVAALNSNTRIILQDDTTITRAYSGLYGTFCLFDNTSMLITGRASILDCVADSGSAVYASLASLAIHGQIKIAKCIGTAYSKPASTRVANTVVI